MKTTARAGLRIRLLCLGEEGVRALPTVAAAVAERWGAGRALDVETLLAGDDAALAARTMRRWCDREGVDAVLTIGRSGHLRADFAPEITAAALTRALPGIEERMHLTGPRGPRDLLFRGRAGLRRATLVVNLPARASRAAAVVGFLAPVLGHALEKARGSDRECGGRAGGK